MNGAVIAIRAAIVQRAENCPRCGQVSTRIHGYYDRTIDDVPISNFAVQICLTIRRFLCNNVRCDQRTFSANVSELVGHYQRKSVRLISNLYHIGQALGGQAGARLARLLSMATSRDTILRIIRTGFQPTPCRPKVIGVDDWAMCKGHKYGTIIVDLEEHKVIDLLPSRSAQELAGWLATQPQIEIVSRDRSKEYQAAIAESLPQACQVADRWHLVKNLMEALERAIEEVYPKAEEMRKSGGSRLEEQALRTRFRRAGIDEQWRESRHQQRIQRYQIVQHLKSQGVGMRRIARLLGLSRGSVRTFYQAETYPETEYQTTKRSILDPFLPYLEQQVQAGCTNAAQLWREIVAQGYPGSCSQVNKWMTWRRRQHKELHTHHRNDGKDGVFLPSKKYLAQLLFAPSTELAEHDTVMLHQVKQVPQLAALHEFVHRFRNMIASKQSADFDGWLTQSYNSNVAALKRFADSIQQERPAILAAITTHWSNEHIAYCTSSAQLGSLAMNYVRLRRLKAGIVCGTGNRQLPRSL